MGPARSPGRRREAGQALAEFAIAAVPVLLLLLGIIQFALIYNSQVGLTNAIRDAARYGSSRDVTNVSSAQVAANATNTLLRASLAKYISPYDANAAATSACYVQGADGTSPGADPAFVTVTAAYNHPLIVPLIGAILDGLDGTPDDNAYRITVTTELRVDNPNEALLSVGTDPPVCNDP